MKESRGFVTEEGLLLQAVITMQFEKVTSCDWFREWKALSLVRMSPEERTKNMGNGSGSMPTEQKLAVDSFVWASWMQKGEAWSSNLTDKTKADEAVRNRTLNISCYMFVRVLSA